MDTKDFSNAALSVSEIFSAFIAFSRLSAAAVLPIAFTQPDMDLYSLPSAFENAAMNSCAVRLSSVH
jgi:hypothetical protein